MSWPLVEISKCVDEIKTWDPAKNPDGSGFTYIDLSAVDKDRKTIDQALLQKIEKKQAPSRARQLVKGGDILVSTVRPNLNGVAMVDLWLDGATASTGYCVLRCNKRLDAKYLFYWVQSNYFIDEMVRLATGANYPAVSDRVIKDSKIPLPPLETQKHIARVLEQADQLRKQAQQMETELNQLAQSLFLEMFGLDGCAVPGTKRVKLNELVSDQDDIKCGPFGTQLGKHEYREQGVPLWGIRHVNSNFSIHTHEYVTVEKAKELKQYSLIADDIVMTRKGTVGNCHLYPKHLQEGVMHSDLLRIRANKEVALPAFLVSVLQQSKDVERQIDLISHGAIMAGINVGKLKSIEIELPPLTAQQKFCSILTDIQSNAKIINQSKGGFEMLFESLMQRAFKGELTSKAA